MFCKKCGNEMPDDIKFCGGCGADQEGGTAAKGAYKAPNFEFKTERCYPSDYEEEKFKNFYEGCGWQIVDMDRKQQYTGQSSDGTRHYSTQTHIKMQRDKNHPNYGKIKELSEQAEAYFNTTPKALSVGKGIKKAFGALLGVGIALLVIGLFTAFILGGGGAGYPPIGVGAALIIIGIIIKAATAKKTKTKKAELMESYNKNKAIADAAFEECKRLVNNY